MTVISLFDYTGEAVRPWAEAGHTCYCLDIQHTTTTATRVGEGYIVFIPADLSTLSGAISALQRARGGAVSTLRSTVAMVFGWPPCTDLASSGARHWKGKRERDPEFQAKAVAMAGVTKALADWLDAPYCIENPVGALSTLWRAPDHRYDPCDFGGYIPEADAVHPTWPEFIEDRDAYTKRTCLWTGNGFTMPEAQPVEPVWYTDGAGNRGSKQWAKLGGKSLRTKNIRSATPRGFARAVFTANGEQS